MGSVSTFAEKDLSTQEPCTVKIVADVFCSAEACTEVPAAIYQQIGQGKAFCAFTETKSGIDITVINIVPYYTMTSNLNNYWFIPYTN